MPGDAGVMEGRSAFAEVVEAAERAGPGGDVAVYDGWILGNPGAAHLFAAWFNLGAALSRDGRLEDAAGCYRQAVGLQPGFHAARLNLGLVLERLGRRDAALSTWEAGVQPDGERTALLNQRARVMEAMGRLGEAERLLRSSLLTDPAQPDAVQHWVHVRQKACLWPVLQALPGLDEAALRLGAGPLGALALTDEVGAQRAAAAAWIGRKTVPVGERLAPKEGYGHQRVRIGYLSSDFGRHAMSYLVAELFERHDRERFEVFGYCIGREDGSALRARVLGAFDKMRLLAGMDDAAAAQVIRDDEIDVLVDLNGLTAGARPQILRWRPAPVQATYLGFVGPVPLPEMDYMLCDAVTVPRWEAGGYGPAPLVVGPVYQANDSRRGAGDVVVTRAEAGLPEREFVFCCFSNHYKITPEVFGAWMRVLRGAPGAVLWLASDTACSRANLEREAVAAGVSPARLVFAQRCDPEIYMARLALADLFLDTFPYNAGTVASDALRMGLPLVTLGGRSFASRMATSLLRQIGAEGFAVESLEEYEALALEMATNPSAAASCTPMFSARAWERGLGDMAGFTRGLEAAVLEVVVG